MRKLLNLPNALSISRIPLAILIIISHDPPLRYTWLAVAALTDFLDGFSARRMKISSSLGANIDGFADKAFMLIVFGFFFIKLDLPLYLIGLFFMRDIVTFIAGAILLKKDIGVQSRMPSKIVTILQFIVIFFLIAENITIVHYGILMVFITALISIIDYAYHIKKKLSGSG